MAALTGIAAPTPAQFAGLARSSPWRWTTLRFTMRYIGDPHRTAPVRAHLRRPNLLRVEDLGGAVLQLVDEPPPRVDGSPEFDADGLVLARPPAPFGSLDAPMYNNYFWVAMLDPVELADGVDDADGPQASTGVPPGTAIDDVTVVDHHGRPAWEAAVRTTACYEPRCGCCSLLRDERIDRLEWEGRTDALLAAYPDHYRVRLDLGTGVCVRTRAVDGTIDGRGHEVVIEAADDPALLADAAFGATLSR